ncbi:MAG TPA: carboxypeptidase-like regulatory domain-containing protein [Thermoanaerobaculia bacterium]
MVLSRSRSTPLPVPAAAPPAAARLAPAALLTLAALLAVMGPAAAQPPAAPVAPRSGEVSLALADYLALTESAERAERARAAAKLRQEPPLAEVVAQRTTVEIDGIGGSDGSDGSGRAGAAGEGEARLVSELEVLVQGHPQSRLALPLAGVALAVEVQPAAGTGAGGAGAAGRSHAAAAAGPAATATTTTTATTSAMVDGGGAATPGLYLVAAEPGRYTVHARSRARFASVHGESRVTLTPIVAPVAVLEIALPAGLAWECPGTVVVEDRVEGGRRHLRLSAGRGLEPVLSLRRQVAGDETAALLAQDDVVTLLQLRPEGLRRHDVVLYEVTRGGLADLVVDLPPGLEVERAGTDEGEVQPVVEGNRLVVHRRRRLQGSGFLVLTSRPAVTAGLLPLGLITPEPPPRARFLAAAASVPGSMEPQPAASWARVDLGDLPRTLGDTLAQLDVIAAWRHEERSAAGPSPPAAVQVITAPQAAALETVVRRRLTTTLLTVDGTLLHLDRFELAQAGEALALTLPAGATLWSAAVDGQPVRPLAAGAGLAVPLGAGGARLVEVVAVLDKVVAKGRSQLAFELAQVRVPVLEHRWRLLLPENARYRFRAADLRPVPETEAPRAAAAAGSQAMAGSGQASGDRARPPTARDPWTILQATPGVLVDGVNVGGNVSGQQGIYIGSAAYFDNGSGNQQGRTPTYTGPAPAGLYGRVVDQGGVVLPGASVTVIASDQVPPQIQLTNARGEFAFPDLAAGVYELKAELRGFSPIQVPGIRVAAPERPTEIDLTLDSAVEDVITVTTESPLLDDKAIRTGNTISQNDLQGFSLDKPRKVAPVRDPSAALNDLRQGLVGGVRPLAVTVPQTGKSLLLAGVLPPARVAIELEVRSGAR